MNSFLSYKMNKLLFHLEVVEEHVENSNSKPNGYKHRSKKYE
jgi:hypothetical protein